MRRSLMVPLALLAIVKSPAAAQTCQGMASFSHGQLQVAGSAQFPEAAKVWGGSLTYGMPSGLYAGADISNTSIDNDGGSSLGIGAHAGYQMKLGRTQKVALCPVANLSLGMGPDDEQADVNSSQTNANFGVIGGAQVQARRSAMSIRFRF